MRTEREARIEFRIWVGLTLFGAGCASMTPEQRQIHELFVEAAGECESRYHTIHVDQIDLDGNLKIHADADSRSEYRYFVDCYHAALKSRAEARQKIGLPVPEYLSQNKDVELD